MDRNTLDRYWADVVGRVKAAVASPCACKRPQRSRRTDRPTVSRARSRQPRRSHCGSASALAQPRHADPGSVLRKCSLLVHVTFLEGPPLIPAKWQADSRAHDDLTASIAGAIGWNAKGARQKHNNHRSNCNAAAAGYVYNACHADRHAAQHYNAAGWNGRSSRRRYR